jgi:hypothetical protein
MSLNHGGMTERKKQTSQALKSLPGLEGEFSTFNMLLLPDLQCLTAWIEGTWRNPLPPGKPSCLIVTAKRVNQQVGLQTTSRTTMHRFIDFCMSRSGPSIPHLIGASATAMSWGAYQGCHLVSFCLHESTSLASVELKELWSLIEANTYSGCSIMIERCLQFQALSSQNT